MIIMNRHVYNYAHLSCSNLKQNIRYNSSNEYLLLVVVTLPVLVGGSATGEQVQQLRVSRTPATTFITKFISRTVLTGHKHNILIRHVSRKIQGAWLCAIYSRTSSENSCLYGITFNFNRIYLINQYQTQYLLNTVLF